MEIIIKELIEQQFFINDKYSKPEEIDIEIKYEMFCRDLFYMWNELTDFGSSYERLVDLLKDNDHEE